MSALSVYLPTHKITKYVQAIQVWRLTTPIDVASCNRLPHFVWICINWKHIICKAEKICDLFCTCCRIALYLDCSETGSTIRFPSAIFYLNELPMELYLV